MHNLRNIFKISLLDSSKSVTSGPNAEHFFTQFQFPNTFILIMHLPRNHGFRDIRNKLIVDNCPTSGRNSEKLF